jgi:DNA-directed RNA polymerase subunit RPC12/RpoP
MTTSGREDIQWGRRVPKDKIQRLYSSDAAGIYDAELIDDVGTTLWVRCRSILEIHEAKRGRVRCPRCARRSVDTFIARRGRRTGGDPRDEELVCPVCGWRITWGDYTKSYKRKQLNAGGAVDVFQRYVDAYPKARTPREKMLAIDRLIHEFHYSLKDRPDQPTRPVAANLIRGKLTEIEAFLDKLTYGPTVPPKAEERRTAWRRNLAARDRWLAEHRRRLAAKE